MPSGRPASSFTPWWLVLATAWRQPSEARQKVYHHLVEVSASRYRRFSRTSHCCWDLGRYRLGNSLRSTQEGLNFRDYVPRLPSLTVSKTCRHCLFLACLCLAFDSSPLFCSFNVTIQQSLAACRSEKALRATLHARSSPH